MDRVAIDLGIIQIYWYSLFIFIGMAIGSFLIVREGKRQGIEEDYLINLIFNSLLIGILGARIYYVIFNLSYYLSNPLEIFAIWNGGLAIHGGIITALIYIVYSCNKNNLITLKVLDISVVGLIIAQAIGRWGNFFNSEAYGSITTLNHLKSLGIPKFIIDGMYIDGAYHHPTFFYESLLCFIGFIILLILRRQKDIKIGQLTSFYLIWYGIGRLIIESFRTDSLMLGPIKIAQLVSIVFIIIGAYILYKSNKMKKNLYNNSSKIKK